MPDYFDRLLARHTPLRAAGPSGGGVARVRPRLPGPFERLEALRTAPPEPDEPASLVPSAPGPAFGPAELIRHEREVLRDRHTVVRTETAPPGDEPERYARAVAPGPGPLLRAAAQAGPVARPGAAEPPRAPRRAGASRGPDGAPPAAGPGAAGPAVAPVPPAGAAAAARPREADTAAARGAGPGGLGRRGSRPAERVVHVQIGRLEVSAAPPPGAPRPGTGRPDPTGRRGPALTLDDYLARGEKRN
ncbi:hypothetical protein [Streptomyces sp. CB03238]|uniref:hypothetical protein n=1 Tax=Streptomyces sp. CB03238 TaxID=1907777 RepID=UPI000A117440|nr:hypothetical protein [Streptomyces sp. CB03238]ORT60645.1 hypothetical protein BKD26_05245 [Streptomyces sp. CB03238]